MPLTNARICRPATRSMTSRKNRGLGATAVRACVLQLPLKGHRVA
jgi:hypothetical protein